MTAAIILETVSVMIQKKRASTNLSLRLTHSMGLFASREHRTVARLASPVTKTQVSSAPMICASTMSVPRFVIPTHPNRHAQQGTGVLKSGIHLGQTAATTSIFVCLNIAKRIPTVRMTSHVSWDLSSTRTTFFVAFAYQRKMDL
tara:strand:- start:449 stop:883 length:435 start_codon:yes stop_codon:yes gene_type:complete